MIDLVLDHLWQSTAFLGLAGLLTLLLRNNRAAARYGLWWAASVKFLIPLSLLSAALRWLAPAAAVSGLAVSASELAQRVSEPFIRGSALPISSAPVPAVQLSTVLLILWAVGCGVVLLSWLIRWRRIRHEIAAGRPLSLEGPIPVRETVSLMEPALVGIWRPVILLPAGLLERLAPAELSSVLAHELSHYRRRDNLTAALHMLVEAVFWFYPPIWWLGARLIAERERACDEAVLAAGNKPDIYAESILKVCRFFAQPAMACTAGVSGADLRRRVEEIMSSRTRDPAGVFKKAIVVIAIGGILSGMVLLGGLSAPVAQAQAAPITNPTPAERKKLLAEQTAPQKEVPFNPVDFDKFVGYYKAEMSPGLYARVYRDGDHYYSQMTGQRPVEFFPESSTKFFATVVAAQISFVTNPEGRVTGMVIHQKGLERPLLRSSKVAYETAEAQLKQRIKDNTPSPGTEAALRRQIGSVERTGHALYAEMDPGLAEAAHQQSKLLAAMFKRMGPLTSLRLGRVLPNGWNDYLGTFAHGQMEIIISPLTPNGKIPGLLYHAMP